MGKCGVFLAFCQRSYVFFLSFNCVFYCLLLLRRDKTKSFCSIASCSVNVLKSAMHVCATGRSGESSAAWSERRKGLGGRRGHKERFEGIFEVCFL